MSALKPLLELEFRRIEAPEGASPDACVYTLLPRLDELLGVPGFGAQDPICLAGSPAPFSPRSFFAAFRERARLH